MKFLFQLWKDESGQDLAEYALVLALICLVAIASMNTIAQAIASAFNSTSNDLGIST